MKLLFAVSAVVLALAIALTQMPPPADVVHRAQAHNFDEKFIADARLFGLERRWLFWGRATYDFLWLSALALTPIGAGLHRLVSRRFGNSLVQIAALGGIAWLGLWLLNLPFRIAGHYLLRTWGMTSQALETWFGEQLIALVVATVAQAIGFLGFYLLLRNLPRLWWLAAGIGSMVLAAVFAFLLPEVVAPLFNKFTPLSETKYADLEPQLRHLGDSVGISTDKIYVVDASRQSSHSNAYFTGMGPRQQIVLYDNLLAKNSPDEVESVVAHEMGHWLHHHILWGILYGGIAVTLALLVLDRILASYVRRGEWPSIGDPAGVFLVIWLGWIATAAAMPIESAISRHFERQADQVSLDVSRKPDDFMSAERRLAIDNKSDVTPSPWYELLFATHPTTVERIEAAEAWKKQQ